MSSTHIFVVFLLLLSVSEVILAKKESRYLTNVTLVGKIYKFMSEVEHIPDYYERRGKFIEKILDDNELHKVAIDEAESLGFFRKHHQIKNVFPCKNYSIPGSGTNINNLTPGDISVVAALGDSLSAGLGIEATSIFGLLFEDKGKVFDMGGQAGVSSLPNFLRVYNRNIKGYSTKTSFMKSKVDGLNVAVSGATSKDIMSQVETLIYLMQNSETIDFDKDWKIINIFIGNNDICRSCEKKNAPYFTVPLFKERLLAALDKLKQEVPRAFVGLITMLDVFEVHNLNEGLICSALHLYECPCVAFSSDIESVIKINDEFQDVIRDIGESDRYSDTDDFVVITQPFFAETNIPYQNGKPDLSYFAPDCFHFSEKGHGQVALSLWNSLFEPVQSKRDRWHVGELFECPSIDRPYLATYKN